MWASMGYVRAIGDKIKRASGAIWGLVEATCHMAGLVEAII